MEALIFAAPTWAGTVGRPSCGGEWRTLFVNIPGVLIRLGYHPGDRAHPAGQMSRMLRDSNQLQGLEMGARRRAQNLDSVAEGSGDFLRSTRSYA
jgi:hypothetical protein